MELLQLGGGYDWAWPAVAVLIAVSALLTAGEAALFSLGPAGLSRLEDEKAASASMIRRLLADNRRLIVTLSQGHESANLAAVILIISVMAAAPESRPASLLETIYHLLFALAVSFSLVLVLGKALPKVFGVLGRDALSRALS